MHILSGRPAFAKTSYSIVFTLASCKRPSISAHLEQACQSSASTAPLINSVILIHYYHEPLAPLQMTTSTSPTSTRPWRISQDNVPLISTKQHLERMRMSSTNLEKKISHGIGGAGNYSKFLSILSKKVQ